MEQTFSRFNAPWQHIIVLILLTLAVALPGLANLPVIDRDEARYVQASVQMAESGDYVNIRFQDQARNKKPAGIYWMQTAMIKAFSKPGERKIWAQRLPSVLGALMAVLATYWGGSRLIGRDGAFIAAMLLAVSGLFVFEAHIAKTDAMLCGFSALTLGCLAHLRNGGGRKTGLLFWVALGGAVMIKGPILPGIALLTIMVLIIWEGRAAWLRPIGFWPGPLLFILIILPWSYLIWQATDGQFFTDALGKDFGGKIVSVQESHPGLPGYYAALIWATFWPSALFLLPGLAFIIRAARGPRTSTSVVSSGARLLIAWTFPFWILIEIMPTKLPHYPLPIFPALAIMCAGAVMTLIALKEFPVARRISAGIFMVISILLSVGIIYGTREYNGNASVSYVLATSIAILGLLAGIELWRQKTKIALWGVIALGVISPVMLYQYALPSLTDLRVSDRVSATFVQAKIKRPIDGGLTAYSPHFREPSLVYRLGGDIVLSGEGIADDSWATGFILILDMQTKEGRDLKDKMTGLAEQRNACLRWTDPVSGFNYSKGDRVSLLIMELKPCSG